MDEMTQLNLRVGESQKERWENYLEESGRYSTLSEFIRTSVEDNILEEEHATDQPSPAFGEDIQELRAEISELQSDVTTLLRHELDEVDISELAQEVYGNLEVLPEPTDSLQIPEDQDATEYRRKRAAEIVVYPSKKGEDPTPQTIKALSDRHGENRTRIETAIEHLQDQFLPVVEVELDGDVHYFREE